jgi:signal transduction histidine kinase
VQSGIALTLMALISIVLGWMVAGRILRRLSTMTQAIQQISAQNLHERLAVEGPPDEMKALSDTVDGLLGRLETALEAQKRFVANAAHELRTPLTLERALLEETVMDPDADLHSFRSTFERLIVICERQGGLLESLLTLASSERGLDRQDPVDLAGVARHAALGYSSRADRQGLRIVTEIAPARTSGDPALVERLVANIVDNAIAYNVPGGHVEISTGTEAGRAVVRVANSGPPVSSELMERLFEPFERLDRSARGEGHHGLGLSIVRAIANAHDATITTIAHPDGGLAITVAFRASADASAVDDRGVPQVVVTTRGTP